MFNEAKIHQLVGSNSQLNDHIGVEVEVEHRDDNFEDLPEKVSRYWRLEGDGSLRVNGGEYVFKKPHTEEWAKKLVGVLGGHIDKNNKVLDTGRAGVHVHVNIGDLSVREFANFLALYHTVEPLLLHWCGKYRKGNLFCLRTIDAEYNVDVITKAFESEELRHLHTDDIRYSALNLKAVLQYGSVEFRAMRSDGKWGDINAIIDVLLNIKTLARQVDNPIQVVADFSGADKEEFVNHILGEHCEEFEKYAGYEDELMDSVRLIQQYAYCREW